MIGQGCVLHEPEIQGSWHSWLEYSIGPQTEIHVTDFQRLVRELQSAHISAFYKSIWLQVLFHFYRGGFYIFGKQMCIYCLLAYTFLCASLCISLKLNCNGFTVNLTILSKDNAGSCSGSTVRLLTWESRLAGSYSSQLSSIIHLHLSAFVCNF